MGRALDSLWDAGVPPDIEERASEITLAQNAGTSVDQLERFYLKRMAPSKEMIENLHTAPPAKHPAKSHDDHLSFLEDDGGS